MTAKCVATRKGKQEENMRICVMRKYVDKYFVCFWWCDVIWDAQSAWKVE